MISHLTKSIERFVYSLTPAGRQHQRMLERLYGQCAALRESM